MSDSKTFYLPDLGEGLPDATIVEWFVKEGDVIRLDEPLVSMETAKAVVEVPSPVSGKVLKLAGGAGDIIVTGSMLAEFQPDPNLPQRAEGQDTGHHHGPPKPAASAPPPLPPQAGNVPSALPPQAGNVPSTLPPQAGNVPSSLPPQAGNVPSTLPPQAGEGAHRADGGKAADQAAADRADEGTVVGSMQSSNAVHTEQAVAVGGIKAMPAVRATARKLGVDLSRVRATGADGAVTMADVKQAAEAGTARIGAGGSPAGAAAAGAAPVGGASAPTAGRHAVATEVAPTRDATDRTALSASGKPMRTQPPGVSVTGQPEQLKGVRRNMARVMADAHAKVVPTTLSDDADVHAWAPGNDVTVRLIRAIVKACKSVPAMNAWFDGDNLTRTLHPHVDIGIAVDTDDGLFVPALRNADILDAGGIRQGINRLRTQVEDRSIPASELSGYTISLSNFGMFAGRYATPVVVPPCVAIVAAGRARHQVTPIMGGFESHKIIPLSVTFDHRACTGGEAARFLKALIDDLALPA